MKNLHSLNQAQLVTFTAPRGGQGVWTVGSDYFGNSEVDVYVDEPAFFHKYLTPEEATALYQGIVF